MYDPISDLIGAIDPARIRRDVDALAAIHSRHVASGAGGIGAAAHYIRGAFAEAGGRLRVSLDSFEEDGLSGHQGALRVKSCPRMTLPARDRFGAWSEGRGFLWQFSQREHLGEEKVTQNPEGIDPCDD